MEENADSTKLEHLIRHVPSGQETVFDLLNKAGESVQKIEISRRKLQQELPKQLPQEDIARAQARNHVFNDIETFADYLCREAHSENSVILADVDKRSITAVSIDFNLRYQIIQQRFGNQLTTSRRVAGAM